jgi:hypothetical protein
MSDARDREMQDLIKGLSKPGARTASAKKPAPKPKPQEKLVLVAGALLILGGMGFLGYSVYSDVSRENTDDSAIVDPPVAIPGGTGGGAIVASGGGGSPGTAISSGSPSTRRDTNAFERFQIDLNSSAFFPPSRLPRKFEGRPVKYYCIMFASLDPATEETWKQAGMFKEESFVLSPYLRTVVVHNQESLELLFDWHVEALTLTQPKLKPSDL